MRIRCTFANTDGSRIWMECHDLAVTSLAAARRWAQFVVKTANNNPYRDTPNMRSGRCRRTPTSPTLNLYAMVADDPETFADLDGHDPNEPDCKKLNPNPVSQVSGATKDAMNNSVKASNSPTSDDKKGGSHEEGGISYSKDGKETVAPATPGAYKDVKQPGVAEIDPYKAADPALQKPGNVQASVDWHAHPSAEVVETSGAKSEPGTVVFGGTVKTQTSNFTQPPSPADRNAANPGTLHVVIGARDKTVYVYNSSGVVCKESLKEFNKPQ